MIRKHSIHFCVILALLTCIAVLLFRMSDFVMHPNSQKYGVSTETGLQSKPLSGQAGGAEAKHAVGSINSIPQTHFFTNGIPTNPQSANNQINEHTISSEKAVSICREDLQRTFPHKSFTLDSVSGVDNHRITVVLADGGPSQNAIPYNRYHFVVDTQRWTILSESIEIIEDMVIVDTPSSR